MSEHLHPPNEPEKPEPKADTAERLPTKQELREFEAAQRSWTFTPYTIEQFGYNKETGPTEEDWKALDEWNEVFRLIPPSFEEYFGYPDPREVSEAGRGEASTPESEEDK